MNSELDKYKALGLSLILLFFGFAGFIALIVGSITKSETAVFYFLAWYIVLVVLAGGVCCFIAYNYYSEEEENVTNSKKSDKGI